MTTPILEDHGPQIVEIKKHGRQVDHEAGDPVPEDTERGLRRISDMELRGAISDLVLGQDRRGRGFITGYGVDGTSIKIDGGEEAEATFDRLVETGKFGPVTVRSEGDFQAKQVVSTDGQVEIFLRNRTSSKDAGYALEIRIRRRNRNYGRGGKPPYIEKGRLTFHVKLRF